MTQTPKNDRVYGFDPGLRHGVLLLSEFDEASRKVGVEICFQWTKKEDHLSLQSTPLELAVFTNKLIGKLTDPALALGIEWDSKSVYMRTHKVQVVVTSFMVGYLSRGAASQGLPLVYITPSQLKQYFGISPKEGKEYINRVLPDLVGWQLPDVIYKDADCFDAFLISFFTWRMSHESIPTPSALFGG